MSARERALKLVQRDLAQDELPDPPDNLDFLDLPEDLQDLFARRLEHGSAITLERTARARYDLQQQARGMRERRQAFEAKTRARHEATRTRQRANKASLGERSPVLTEAYLAAHRASNSGSGR